MRRYVIIFILVIISTYLIHLGLIHAGLFPVEASAQAIPIDKLFQVHLWMISFLFSLIMVTMIYSLIAFHRRKGEVGDGAYLTGSTPLEITWTSIPLVAVLVLAFVGARTLGDIRVVDPSALQIRVTSGQWFWQFIYPDYTVAGSELYLPVNRQIDLLMTSTDVIHSFWVPEFRIKQDIVPGRTNELRFTPTLIGEYQVRCAELCGLRHAYMEAKVHVVSQADFDNWIKQQQASTPASPELRGELFATQYGCANCHSTDGTAKTGPTWLHLYNSQVKLSDGSTVTADDNYIKDAILRPHLQVVAGFPDVMPDFGTVLDENTVGSLLAYLKTLK
jgi:cytochrome c oxidase subunit 2